MRPEATSLQRALANTLAFDFLGHRFTATKTRQDPRTMLWRTRTGLSHAMHRVPTNILLPETEAFRLTDVRRWSLVI